LDGPLHWGGGGKAGGDAANNPILLLPDLDTKFVFIALPLIEVLRERLTNRSMETEELLEGQLHNAVAEIKYGAVLGAFHFVIGNNELKTAGGEFVRAIEALYLG
jgi:guanylate kinase